MLISLDYDNTFDRDPIVWLKFVRLMQEHGHTVVCITMRTPQEKIDPVLAGIVETLYTSRRAKRAAAWEKNWSVDVWVDDSPVWVDNDAIPKEER